MNVEPPRGRVSRSLWLALGFSFVTLGMIGAVLPLMPTTIFLILAAACFARSSPRLEAKILTHPRFGPLVLDWRARGAIPPLGKLFATTGIVAGYAIFTLTADPEPPLAIGVAAALALCAAWILSRPS